MKKRRVTQISNRAFLKFEEGYKLLYLKESLKNPSSLLCMMNISNSKVKNIHSEKFWEKNHPQ